MIFFYIVATERMELELEIVLDWGMEKLEKRVVGVLECIVFVVGGSTGWVGALGGMRDPRVVM